MSCELGIVPCSVGLYYYLAATVIWPWMSTIKWIYGIQKKRWCTEAKNTFHILLYDIMTPQASHGLGLDKVAGLGLGLGCFVA